MMTDSSTVNGVKTCGDSPDVLVRQSAIPPPPPFSDSYKLFAQFVEEHLGLKPGTFLGFQSTFGHGEDLICFRCPITHSTICVKVGVLMMDGKTASEVVASKVRETQRRFYK
jgi:hypothetical protein